MITMQEARDRVDARLASFAERPVRVVEVAPLSCAGSGVSGPDLAVEVKRATTEMTAYLVRGDDLMQTLAGFMIRTFWLGYEHGTERDS